MSRLYPIAVVLLLAPFVCPSAGRADFMYSGMATGAFATVEVTFIIGSTGSLPSENRHERRREASCEAIAREQALIACLEREREEAQARVRSLHPELDAPAKGAEQTVVPGQPQVRLTCAAPAALLPRRIDGHFALIHRPTVARDADRLRTPAVAR